MELITADDVRDITKWQLVTVYRKAARGDLPGVVKLGRSLRFDKAVIDQWLEGQRRVKQVRGTNQALNAPQEPGVAASSSVSTASIGLMVRQ